jgi:hypothetical protein
MYSFDPWAYPSTGYLRRSQEACIVHPNDELRGVLRWRNATPERHGEFLAAILDVVSAVRWLPPKEDMFPGWKTIVGRKQKDTGQDSADA